MSSAGLEFILEAKDLCLLCLDICTPEGGGVEKGGSVNFKKAYRTFDPRINSTWLRLREGNGTPFWRCDTCCDDAHRGLEEKYSRWL